MKISILVPLFPPMWVSGTEIATYNIAMHLAKRKHDVHLITSLDKYLPKESFEGGFHIHRISQQKVRLLGAPLFWLKIFWLMKKISPDIVHVQNIAAGIPGFFAKKILKKPYVVWGRGSEVYLPWRFKRTISKMVLRNADAVIALSEDMKREIRQIWDRDVIVIPNGIDLENFTNLSRAKARHELKISEDRKLVLFVGKLHPIKGIKYLIQAISIIERKDTHTKLLLVGDGEEMDDLRDLSEKLNLQENISFIGKVPNGEVLEYMAAADIFVLPSLHEGFPMVSLEAMASGLPVVATRVGGLPEIIRDGRNGFLVESKNSEEIAEKILLLLEDKEMRKKISRDNREKARNYTWENIVQRLEAVYQRVKESDR